MERWQGYIYLPETSDPAQSSSHSNKAWTVLLQFSSSLEKIKNAPICLIQVIPLPPVSPFNVENQIFLELKQQSQFGTSCHFYTDSVHQFLLLKMEIEEKNYIKNQIGFVKIQSKLSTTPFICCNLILVSAEQRLTEI